MCDLSRLYPAVQLAVSLLVAMTALSGRSDLCSHFLTTQMHSPKVFSQAPPSAVKAVRAGSCPSSPKRKRRTKPTLWFDCGHDLAVRGLHEGQGLHVVLVFCGVQVCGHTGWESLGQRPINTGHEYQQRTWACLWVFGLHVGPSLCLPSGPGSFLEEFYLSLSSKA